MQKMLYWPNYGQPGLVKAMLEKPGSDASRPDDLAAEFGLGRWI